MAKVFIRGWVGRAAQLGCGGLAWSARTCFQYGPQAARSAGQTRPKPRASWRISRIRGVNATVLNISTYRFAALQGLEALRERIATQARQAGIKGTVLLATEGINLFVAGEPAATRQWLANLGEEPALAGLLSKESFTKAQPFARLKVKIKREIIRMDSPQVRPQQGRAPALPAKTLERWLAQGHDDAGRPLRLLDARNAFEVDAGAFEGAMDWRLSKFSDFPAALALHAAELQGCAVVSYCTGGIRCEKAALLMQANGLEHVWQLDGGILDYFAQTQGRAPGWQGECFVFDDRTGLRPDLSATVSQTQGALGPKTVGS